MPAAPQPPEDQSRGEPSPDGGPTPALPCAQMLSALPEDAFDRVTRLARHLLGLPHAAVHLALGEPPECLCASPWTGAPGESGVLLLPGARHDPRFGDHPAIRAGTLGTYAGAALLTQGGHRLGTLCAWGPEPRAPSLGETETLRLLAALVTDELELRRRAHELTQARDQARTLRDLAELTSEPLSAPEIAQRALRLLARTMRLEWAGLLHLAPHAPGVLSDHAAEGPGPATFARLIRHRLTAGHALETALLGWERVFLDSPQAVAARGSPLLTPDLGSAAWLHVQVAGGPVEGGQRTMPEGAHVLLLARLGEPAVWTPDERLLLEAAARSVGVALERAGHVQALRRAALQDALTGLGNRRALDDALDDADRRLGQTGTGYVLGVVDLDGMKRVNDEGGHASGDTLLREFAHALVRPGLSAYRLGGDEYALLTTLRPAPPHPTPPQAGADPWTGAREGARRLREQVEAAAGRVQTLGYAVEASLGVACVPQEAPDATAALRAADARMYTQKRARRAARSAGAGGGQEEAATPDGDSPAPLPWRA